MQTRVVVRRRAVGVADVVNQTPARAPRIGVAVRIRVGIGVGTRIGVGVRRRVDAAIFV